MKLDTDRNRIESEILVLEGKLAPGYVPEIYFYDTVMSACGMEDLSDHEIMRTAMLEHKIFPKFADQISTFMAQVLMGTTDVVMHHQEKKNYSVNLLIRNYAILQKRWCIQNHIMMS